MSDERARLGFLLAGLYNLMIIVFSRGFSPVLGDVDPLFGTEGTILIFLWGLAYMATRSAYAAAPLLAGVFCLEKLFFVQHWGRWMAREGGSLGELFAADPLTGFFYGVYGVGDALFGVFFGMVCWRYRN